MAVSEEQQQYMSIGAQEGQTKSFEEVRCDDYLKAYIATGRPPQPVPLEPASEVARAGLGYPPLFQPYRTGKSSTVLATSTASKITPTITNLTDLPVIQEFKANKVDSESYQSIVCHPEYSFFSPEELRYHAYFKGQKMAPPTLKMDPFVLSSTPSSIPATEVPAVADPRENMQSIACQPLFIDHSFEELRVAYMLSGKELNSAEIRQFLNLPGPPTPAVPPTPGSHALLGPPATPQHGTGAILGPPANTTMTPPVPSLNVPSHPAFSFKFGA
ncbi:hypothetical protein FA15DRAFT_511233 [Coprinopsis marcescibilis]|uniref:Uncharacterized protein n=1 Tax=Coprinopsis marcescibilis TaxID=230819 RepID=A0A5C3KQ08_COPMA|nr:hypothetical protein FA15DRAFT_511233 [Coprinopsis marcescibilis]